MAHMGHPWYEECIVVARKNPNVYCEISALYYRPWQFWNILICAQEYGITERDKIFLGHRLPVHAGAGLGRRPAQRQSRQVEGSGLPRVSGETIERILRANPLDHWWHGGLR